MGTIVPVGALQPQNSELLPGTVVLMGNGDSVRVDSILNRKMAVNEVPVVLQTRHVLPSSGKEIVIVSINRPDRLNCFNSEVCDALASIFASLHGETDLAAVILTGEGSSFCAGADLSNPPNPLIQSSDLPEHLAVNPVHQMSSLQVPLIGALRGYVRSCV